MADSATPIYEVTATKRRPQTFDELAGQEFVVSTLKNSLQSGHIAHAYLFSGPRGCGKTSAARILARSLNCEEGPGKGPCGVCDNCKAIKVGASMDVIEIDGATDTGINVARQIKDEVLFPPQAGRYKVYIIDEVHMLTMAAFNALLKTIEEPPPYIVFVFATTELHKVPATIKSRCQQFNFRLIPIETIQQILKKVCAEIKIEAEDDALLWIAHESTGSLRDAFTLFDQVVSFSDGHIRSSLIREKLGIVGLEKLNALAESCAACDTAAAFALTDEILSAGVAIEQFVIDLTGYYRSLLLLKNGVVRESLLGYSPHLFSAKTLETFDSIRLEQALELLLDCYRNIRYSVSPRFELETAVSKLAWLSRWVSPTELKAAVDQAQNLLRGAVPAHTANTNGTAQGGIGRPLANGFHPGGSHGTAVKAPPAYAASTVNENPLPGSGAASSGAVNSGGYSPAENFRRMLAAKTAGLGSGAASSGAASSGATSNGAVNSEGDADDIPMWSNIAHNSENQIDRLLRLIPGTVIQPTSSP